MTSSPQPPVVFLPVITKVRELDARLLLAAHLAREGWTVVLGETGQVTRLAEGARDGVYVTPILVPAAAERLRAMRLCGHAIVGWDEEGLVYPDPAWYFADRISTDSISELDVYVAWGPQPAIDLRLAHPDVAAPVLDLGNPRIDLLRAPFRDAFDEDAEALRRRHGPYVLVNTNFDLVNHADGAAAFRERLRRSGRIRSAQDEARYDEWARFRGLVWNEFKAGIERLRVALPALRFVIRPHPSESLRCWAELAQRVPGVEVAPAVDNVVPWILGSTAVLHNSCTTAVEAHVLGVPVVAFRPPGTDVPSTSMESPLPNDVAGEPLGQEAERDAALARFVSATTGPFASQRITEVIGTLRDPSPTATIESSRSSLATRVGGVRARSAARLRSGVRSARSTDARQRFPGLGVEEAAVRLATLAHPLGEAITCRSAGPDVVVVKCG
jgi:surface carbohydrate biosynthesis protein